MGCVIQEVFKKVIYLQKLIMQKSIMIFYRMELPTSMIIQAKQEQQAACEKINAALSRKQLSLSYNKSKYIIIGNKNKRDREKILKEIKEIPLRMGNSMIENSREENTWEMR